MHHAYRNETSELVAIAPDGSPNFRWLLRQDGEIVLQHRVLVYGSMPYNEYEWRDIPTVREIDIERGLAA